MQAQERFDAGASAVSLFLVLQLAVYAAMQVPVGVALDRFGSRRMIVAGSLTMAAGQLVLALAGDVPTAVAARVLVGAGDAMTFISVLRVVQVWFTGRTVPIVTQLTGILGQIGQIVAAYPLVALLRDTSWSSTFPPNSSSVWLTSEYPCSAATALSCATSSLVRLKVPSVKMVPRRQATGSIWKVIEGSASM